MPLWPSSRRDSSMSLARFCVLLGLFCVLIAPIRARAQGKVDFQRQIRLILSNHCFKCHGPDAETREAGLRLDEREPAVAKAESGATAIVPGKPDESELVKRIFAHD